MSELTKLDRDDRIRLVQDLWDSIAEQDCEPPLSDALRAELQTDLEESRRDPQTGQPWQQVKAQIRGSAWPKS